MLMGSSLRATAIALVAMACAAAVAQHPRQLTTQDYATAEKFMPYNMNPLAWPGEVKAQSLDDGRFWYKAVDDTGISYVVVDPAKGTRGSLFDQDKVAALLNAATHGAMHVQPRHLHLSNISFSDGGHVLYFRGYGGEYRCDLGAAPPSCARIGGGSEEGAGAAEPAALPPLNLSPDKKLGAFIRDWNLWVKDLATG